MIEQGDVSVFGHPPAGAHATVRPSAYGLVIDRDGRLGVVRTPQGLFLAGGGIEPRETPHDAVVREMREECGLDVSVSAGAAGSEADHELVWVTPQEAITQLAHPSHRWAVTQWLGLSLPA